MLPPNKVLLLVRIPREIERRVLSFEQLLVNIHEALAGHTISFELLAYEQYIYFFVGIDRELRDLLEGQIYAQYPDAEIEESGDYIKSEILERGFVGTELKLKKSDVIPIKTYSEFEGDSLAGLFSFLTKTGEHEQIWVHIIIEPMVDSVRFSLSRSLKNRMTGVQHYLNPKTYFNLSSARSMRKVQYEAAQKKADHKAYKVRIRLACCAATQLRAQQKLTSLIATFQQFNTLHCNGFRPLRPRNSEQFLALFQSRSGGGGVVLGVKEVASIYHYPHPDEVGNVVHVLAKKAEPPRDIPHHPGEHGESASIFGLTNYHNRNTPFGINRVDRRRHLYALGKSGTGKSKLLELLIIEDIKAGYGVGVIDPHGDLVDTILLHIPPERLHDVVLFNPADYDYPVAFNPLGHVPAPDRMRVTVGFIEIFKKLFAEAWNARMEYILRFATLAALEYSNSTIISVLKMLSDPHYRQTMVPSISDDLVRSFWENEFEPWRQQHESDAILPLVNKIGQCIATPLLRNIIAQPINRIDIEAIMNTNKIFLMRIAKGNLGEENVSFIGSLIITKMHQAAMARTSMPQHERRDFYLYVDEFQYFATDTFAEIFSEARKYRLNLTIAHQHLGQLSSAMRTTTLGNVGSIISFRTGSDDAIVLENEFTPVFHARDIVNLGVREFYIKTSVDGEIRDAFSGKTITVPEPLEDQSALIRDLSRNTYARPRESVEAELKASALHDMAPQAGRVIPEEIVI